MHKWSQAAVKLVGGILLKNYFWKAEAEKASLRLTASAFLSALKRHTSSLKEGFLWPFIVSRGNILIQTTSSVQGKFSVVVKVKFSSGEEELERGKEVLGVLEETGVSGQERYSRGRLERPREGRTTDRKMEKVK